MSFLEIALQYAARGWFVHPLGRAEKRPITGHGKDDATTEPAVIREWWSKWPNANIGIAGGPSWLLVFDADHGLNTEEDFIAWRYRNGLPVTYTVRTGSREGFRVKMYYKGSTKDGKFSLDGVTGDNKSQGGLVLAAGSIHPDSKEACVQSV